MIRSMLSASAAVVLLSALFAGSALAQDDPPAARACETVRSELASAQAAATLPVTIDGVTYPNLGAVQTALAGLPVDVPAVQPLVDKLQAVVDAAAKVTLLEREATTCVENPGTTEPTPTVEPTTDAPTTTVAPTTGFAIPTEGGPKPSSDDGDVADSVPQGSVNTGGY